MSNKTGSGLAAYAIAQLGRPYWWGTFGQLATRELLAAKRKQYPDEYTAADFERQFGQRVHDCVGLIKGYLWSDGPDAAPRYNAAQDVSVSGLRRVCDKSGGIDTLPEIPGVCVFNASLGHVGVYIGNGKVVEAMGHAYGVVKTDLRSRGWASWGMPRWIDYGAAQEDKPQAVEVPVSTVDTPKAETCSIELPVLQKGSKGGSVWAMQLILIGKGFRCGPWGSDGEFGDATYGAVYRFQRSRGLPTDGVCGPQTWKALITT